LTGQCQKNLIRSFYVFGGHKIYPINFIPSTTTTTTTTAAAAAATTTTTLLSFVLLRVQLE
jgi:hypothetical protein